MIVKIGIGIAAAVVLLALGIAARPATFHIERSVTITAPAESAFARVNDFRQWVAWSPYEKLDPAMQKSYTGSPSGVGAIYEWAGNDKAGAGRATIEQSDEPSQIVIKLKFARPCSATNRATFTFTPVPEGTAVTWAIDGRHSFVGKAFALVMNIDKLVGTEFERGLAALKTVAETASKAETATAHAAR